MRWYASCEESELGLARIYGLPRILFSFATCRARTWLRYRRSFEGTLLDSGAYAVASRGARIDLAQYIETCQALGPMLDGYANLDVIGDYHATERNQRAMEAAGLTPLPTFHFGSPYSVLRGLLGEYEYIGIGGIARVNARRRMAWLDEVWSIIRATRWPMRTHGWGVTSPEALRRYPWFSVDSTSWKASKRWGQLELRDGYGFKATPRDALPGAYAEHSRHGYLLRMRKGAQTYLEFVDEVTRTWALRGVSWS